jgi:hypothetical protein
MSSFEKIVIGFPSSSLEEFRVYAERAKAANATHVLISQMPKSFWMWEADLSNPYPNWSMHHCQLFKLIIPPPLKGYLPADHVAECFKLVADRCDILERLGLKAALNSNEPFWLPDAVFTDHPSWRGPRVDHPRRSTVPYYAPCIDNPEVLDLYSYAAEELAKKTNVDYVGIMSNDSGGGICWSTGLYPGPNGPSACRNRSMGDRITGFINALSKGAEAGGRSILFNFNANLGFKEPEYQVDLVWPRLKENQIVNGRDREGRIPVVSVNAQEMYLNPLRDIPLMMRFARSLDAAAASARPVVTINVPQSDMDEAWVYLDLFFQKPTSGFADTVALVKEAAARVDGPSANALVDIWQQVDDAVTSVTYLGLNMLQYGTLHQRWINRPFVPFPDELAPEYRDYYRKFQFQAQDGTHAGDLMDIQGIEAIRGFSGVFLAVEALRRGRQSIANARKGIAKLSADKTGELKSKFLLISDRLQVLDCFLRCIANAARFQEIIDRTDFEAIPKTECRWPTRNDPRIEQMQGIMRDEIDNVNELALLIEGRVKLFLSAEDDARLEDIFNYGPDLANQLRLKARIMLDHYNDLNRIYETNNI